MPAKPTTADHPPKELVRFNDHLAWSQWLRSLDYFRCIEYQFMLGALSSLAISNPLVLEWGVGTSPLPQYLADSARVIAMDLDRKACAWQTSMQQRHPPKPHNDSSTSLCAVCANGLSLPIPTACIDIAIAVGALEHALEDLAQEPNVPRPEDRGDTLALLELARVLKPGAALLLTVPWSHKYTQAKDSAHTKTFERRYSDRALADRLIRPSGLIETSRSYFGEPGFRFSNYWYRLPFLLKLPFRRLVPRASNRFLAELPVTKRGPSKHACGVFLWLEKPPSGGSAL